MNPDMIRKIISEELSKSHPPLNCEDFRISHERTLERLQIQVSNLPDIQKDIKSLCKSMTELKTERRIGYAVVGFLSGIVTIALEKLWKV